MEKYKKISYIFLIIFTFLVGIFLFFNMSKSKQSENDVKSKCMAEIKMLDNKFTEIFNKLNNISYDNYKISQTENQNQEEDQNKNQEKNNINKTNSDENNSNIKGENKNNSQSTNSQNSNESDGASSSNNSNTSDSSSTNKKYELEETGILTESNEKIDWKEIKNETELLYNFLYTTTIDLYQITNNQEDIINFNKKYDNLVKNIQNENKEDVLKSLSDLYGYIDKFIDNISDDNEEKDISRTKKYIFKAYTALETEDWEEMTKNINNASQEFAKLVTDVSKEEKQNKYNINKAYIIINEMQNAVNLKDRNIFLIKYKNLLEELKNI